MTNKERTEKEQKEYMEMMVINYLVTNSDCFK
jgi:hypothetical protein